MWGEAPICCDDVHEIFAKYIEGKIPILPWCESALQPETSTVSCQIAELNRRGFLSINSQPAVNGEKSDHPLFGWGGAGGRVYQKAYLEFFTSPENLKLVKKILEEKPNLVFYAVDCEGTVCTSSTSTSTSSANGGKNVTALTWGVFPNKEILQPTIFDPNTFLVWSQEAFELWTNAWAALYDDETDSSALIYEVSVNQFLDPVVVYLSLSLLSTLSRPSVILSFIPLPPPLFLPILSLPFHFTLTYFSFSYFRLPFLPIPSFPFPSASCT